MKERNQARVKVPEPTSDYIQPFNQQNLAAVKQMIAETALESKNMVSKQQEELERIRSIIKHQDRKPKFGTPCIK